MYCPHCGTPLEPGMRFCPGCGAARGSRPRPPWREDEPEDPGAVSISDRLERVPGAMSPPDRRDEEAWREPPPGGHDGDRLTAAPRSALQAGARPAEKSYVGWAFLAAGLYLCYWIPGLIANVILWRKAIRFQRESGSRARGTGCLVWLFWVLGVALPILVLVVGTFGS